MAAAGATVLEDDVTAAGRMQALYDTHSGPVFQFLLRLTFGDRVAAEDFLQETMMRAWRKIDELNHDVSTLRPWLFTVARRIAIDAGRAKQARPPEVGLTDLSALSTGEDPFERMLAAQTVRRAMARLSPEHRAVIIEIYYRERTAPEAAARLRIPEGTVKSRTYHALRALRAAIGELEAGR